MLRALLASTLLLAAAAAAQPATYTVPIVGRTSTSSPLPGTGAIDVSLWLSDPGDPVGSSLLFGTAQTASSPFLLGTLAAGQVTSFPSPADAVATATGAVIQGNRHTLLAVVSSGTVDLGVIKNGTFTPVVSNLVGSPPIALGVKRDGGATLLVSDATATALTRYDVDPSTPGTPSPGLTISALTEPMRSLFLDGAQEVAWIGGNTNGNVYFLDARLDGGPPMVFDAALTSQGRLAPPVTGLAAYLGQNAYYLLVTSTQGMTVYDLTSSTPLSGAFRIIASDSVGQLTGPTGVAVTNLASPPMAPKGSIALGDPTARGLALLRWDDVADAGRLVVDTSTDPRGPAPTVPDGGGGTDGGTPDGGGGGGGGGGQIGGGGGGPLTPGIPIHHTSGCTSAGGGPALAGLLALLLLLVPRRRQRP